MKKITGFVKRTASILLVEVCFVGVLSFGLNQYVLKRMGDWTLCQYLLLISAMLVVAGIIYLAWEGIGKILLKRREMQVKKKVEKFQLSVLQEFFRIQMERSYGQAWPAQVKTVVDTQCASNNSGEDCYQSIRNVLNRKSAETLDEKDIDFTCVSALMLDGFYSQCRVGTAFAQQMRNICTDKNMLSGHNPDPKNPLNIKILELTMLKNLRSFLVSLRESNWAYAGKVLFAEKHLNTIEELTGQLFRGVGEDAQSKVDFESSRICYLNRLIEEQADNAKEYLPLRYKASDGTSEEYFLETLDALPNNQQGFVLFADAGYGKTWSIQELAGQYAQMAMQHSTGHRVTPVLVKMGPLAAHSEPILKAVQEYLFPGMENLEKVRQFLHQEHIVLFVDGMDEANTENKERARDELIRLRQNAQNLRIVGGTRESDVKMFPPELCKYVICSLTDQQARDFMCKLITDPEQQQLAVDTYFNNEKTSFLHNLRSPFYLKCYVDFVLAGETDPTSDTDMMSRCMDRMIQREINIKGFPATVEIINAFLRKMAQMQGNQPYLPVTLVLKEIEKVWAYHGEGVAPLFQIKDTLVELQILREIPNGRQEPMICFWHQKYKELYSPVAVNMEVWNY